MALPKIPEIETLGVADSRRQYSELLDRVQRDGARFIIEKHGISVAGIVPMSAMRLVQEREQARQNLLDVMDDIRGNFEGIPEEEVEREVEKALADIKRERLLARRIVSAVRRIAPDAFDATDDQLERTVAGIFQEEASNTGYAMARGE